MDTQPANRIWPPTLPRHYTTRGKKIPLSHQLLRMGTRWPETCWATYKGEINIILSDIQLVSYSALNYDARSTTHENLLYLFIRQLTNDHSNYWYVSRLSTTYKILTIIILPQLAPYTEDITRYHQCRFQWNRSTAEQLSCTCHILVKKLGLHWGQGTIPVIEENLRFR